MIKSKRISKEAEAAARKECAYALETALDCDGFKHRHLPEDVEDEEFFAAVGKLIEELRQ